MATVYHYFNPAIVELLATAKFGSMSKFLTIAKREASWWHRSKKKPTVKWHDLELLAEVLGCHPCEFIEEMQNGGGVSEELVPYTSSNSAISNRITQLITLKTSGSQARFAEITQMGESQVSNITTKKHSPGFHTLSRIVNAFPDINARWLLTGSGSPIASEAEDSSLRALLESKDEIINLLKAQLSAKK